MCFVFFSTIIVLDTVGALNVLVSLLAPDRGENTNSEAGAEAGESEPGQEAKNGGLVLLEILGLLVLLLTNATALHGLRWGSLVTAPAP